MNQRKLKNLLTRRLGLVKPSFRLERSGSKVFGKVICDTFKGTSDFQRLEMIWDVLEGELGTSAVREVGMLLTYTWDEWNIDLPAEGELIATAIRPVSSMKLQQVLSRKLRLRKPVFKLKKFGTKVAGSIISETFKGKSDRQRQTMLWDAVVAEFGPESFLRVGMLIAYTPDEWNIDML